MDKNLRAQAQEKLTAADRIGIECRAMVKDAGDAPTEAQIAAIEAKAEEAQQLRADAQDLQTRAARLDRVNAGLRTVGDASLVDRSPAGKQKDPLAFGKALAAMHPSVVELDPQFRATLTGYPSELIGEEGGYLIPIDQRREISSNVFGAGSLLGKLRATPTSRIVVKENVDEDQIYDTTNIDAAWVSEGVANNQGKVNQFDQVETSIRDCSVMVSVPNSMLNDTPFLQAYVTQKLALKIAHKLEATIMLASQSGAHPFGLVSSAKGVTVETSTSLDDKITAADVFAMYDALNPESRRRAFWIANTHYDMVLAQTNDADGNPLYRPEGSGSLAQAPLNGRLLGLPMISSLYSPAIGQVGDLMALDPNAYGFYVRQNVEQTMSVHFAFDQRLTCFMATIRVGGQMILNPVTLPDNTVVAQLVRLATRS